MSDFWYSIEEDLEETRKCLKETQQELQRKDNIINELKKWLNEFETKEFNYNFLVVRVKDILDKIKELENDS